MNLPTKITLFLCTLLFVSCASERVKSTNKLIRFLEIFSYQYEDVSSVLVLTEEGCPACNRSFANLIEESLDDSSTVFIISAKGNSVDLSSFIDQDQVIIDMENTFGELKLTKGTASIFLTPTGLIDTVVAIQAKSLTHDLEYISSRLKQQ